MKHLKESIMSDKATNQDIKTLQKTLKVQRRQLKSLKKNLKKILEVIRTVFYGLPTNKFKYLRDLN